MQQLDIATVDGYRTYVAAHPQEWTLLDTLCRVTVSRFYRDKMIFAFLAREVLPVLAAHVQARTQKCLRVWSAGSASGEEPYTIILLWAWQLQRQFPSIGLEVVATDIDRELIRRADTACYPYSAIKNLPPTWREKNGTRIE